MSPARKTWTICILSCFVYVLMEWLFFITKPSFFYKLSTWETIRVLAVTPLYFMGLCVLPWAAWVLGKMVFRDAPDNKAYFVIPLVVPSLVLASTAFLLFDNFTYTLFGIGVESNHRGRYLYGVIFVLLSYRIGYALVRGAGWKGWERTPGKVLVTVAILLMSSSIVIMIPTAVSQSFRVPVAQTRKGQTDRSRQYNILILSTDGVDISHMSAYGYRRDTTPNIKKLFPRSLVFDRHFVNASDTTGSIGSLLTGKNPMRTRVIQPPDIFIGEDSYQHLPGLLRKMGYRTADISIRYYADPYDMNLRKGFDWANNRKEHSLIRPSAMGVWISPLLPYEYYFLEQLLDRLLVRLKHAFGIEKMENPSLELTDPDPDHSHDSKILPKIFDFIGQPGPYFLHVHFMNTHGPWFNPVEKVFSKGETQNKPWHDDFFDDAILDYDRNVAKILESLEKKNLLERTVVIMLSDHGPNWTTDKMIPLIIRFPYGEHVGRVSQNVQTLDVAPTILDYLGFEVPKWMEGKSLISKPIGKERYIFIAQTGETVRIGDWKFASKVNPPFYSLGEVSVVYKNTYCTYNIANNSIFCKLLSNDDILSNSIELNDNNAKYIISNMLCLYGYPKLSNAHDRN